jgi:hypothetical protein
VHKAIVLTFGLKLFKMVVELETTLGCLLQPTLGKVGFNRVFHFGPKILWHATQSKRQV